MQLLGKKISDLDSAIASNRAAYNKGNHGGTFGGKRRCLWIQILILLIVVMQVM